MFSSAIFISLLIMLAGLAGFAEERPSADAIPAKSIILGTYIIDYQMIETQVIEAAQATVDESGQSSIFFKSDITTTEAWIDITNGDSALDITDASKKLVTKAVIDALPLTHWVKADGTVVVFGSEETLTVNTLVNLKDPSVNAALDSLAVTKALVDSQYLSDSSLLLEKQILDAVFSLLPDEATQSYDVLLNAMDQFAAANVTDPSMLATLKALKDQVAMEKQAAVTEALVAQLQAQADKALKAGLNTLNADIWTAIGTLQSDLASLEAQLETDGDSGISALIESYREQAIKQLTSGTAAGALTAIEKLAALERLAAGTAVQNTLNDSLLAELLQNSVKALNETVSEGGGEAYNAAVAAGESEGVVNNALTAQSLLMKGDLDNLMTAIDMKLGMVSDTAEKISVLESYETVLAGYLEDSALPYALQVVIQGYLDDLKAQRMGLEAASDEGTVAQLNLFDVLAAKIDNLTDAYLSALDTDDTALAQSIQTAIQDLKDQRDALYESNLASYGIIAAQIEALNGILASTSEDAVLTALVNASPLLQGLSAAAETPVTDQTTAEALLDMLMGLQAKYALLISPEDQKMAAYYEACRLAVQESAAETTIDADVLENAYSTWLEAYQMLTSALQNAGDIQTINAVIIARAKDAYLTGEESTGDFLLALVDSSSDFIAQGEASSGTGESQTSGSGNGATGDGTVGDGTAGDGTAGDGTAGDGTAGDGTAGDGTAGDGTAGDGTAGDGTAGDGTAGDGTAGDGTAGDGTAGDGTAGDGTAGDGIVYGIVTTATNIVVTIPAIEKNGLTYLPVKRFYQYFGIETTWLEMYKRITIQGIVHTVSFEDGNAVGTTENEQYFVEGPMVIIDGISYLPMSWFTSDIDNYYHASKVLIIIPIR